LFVNSPRINQNQKKEKGRIFLQNQNSLAINACDKDLMGIRTPSSMKMAKLGSRRGSIYEDPLIKWTR